MSEKLEITNAEMRATEREVAPETELHFAEVEVKTQTVLNKEKRQGDSFKLTPFSAIQALEEPRDLVTIMVWELLLREYRMCLFWQKGRTRDGTITVSLADQALFCISRKQLSRALSNLEKQGCVKLVKGAGKKTRVDFNSVTESIKKLGIKLG